MKIYHNLKRALARTRRLWKAGKYERALTEATRLRETWPDHPPLLILWANLVQLQPSDDAPSLDEAKAALRRATELDEESPLAWIELGNFVNAVEDDATGASKCFAKAIALGKQQFQQALLGQAQVMRELDKKPAALACLAEAYWLQSHNGKSASVVDSGEILERLHELAQTD